MVVNTLRSVRQRQSVRYSPSGARVVALVAALLLVVPGLSACTTQPGSREATGMTGRDGFRLELKDVTATAGGDVAAKNTPVILKREAHHYSGLPAGLHAAGASITLTLGKGEQPKSGITLRFKVDQSKIPRDAGGFAVVTQKKGEPSPQIMVGKFDPSSDTVTVKTRHLSPFSLFVMSVGDFFHGLGTTLDTAWGANFPTPDCLGSGKTATASYTISNKAGVVPCIEVDAGQAKLVLHSINSSPYALTTKPAQRGAEDVGGSLKDAVSVAVARALRFNQNSTTLLPGAQVSYDIDDSAPIQTIKVDQDPSVTLLGVLFTMADEAKVLEPIEDSESASGVLSCAGGAVGKPVGTSASAAGQVIRKIIDCIDLVAGINPVWLLLTAAPAALISLCVGFLNEVTGQGHFALTLVKTAVPAPATGLLVNDEAQNLLTRGATGVLLGHTWVGQKAEGEGTQNVVAFLRTIAAQQTTTKPAGCLNSSPILALRNGDASAAQSSITRGQDLKFQTGVTVEQWGRSLPTAEQATSFFSKYSEELRACPSFTVTQADGSSSKVTQDVESAGAGSFILDVSVTHDDDRPQISLARVGLIGPCIVWFSADSTPPTDSGDVDREITATYENAIDLAKSKG